MSTRCQLCGAEQPRKSQSGADPTPDGQEVYICAACQERIRAEALKGHL